MVGGPTGAESGGTEVVEPEGAAGAARGPVGAGAAHAPAGGAGVGGFVHVTGPVEAGSAPGMFGCADTELGPTDGEDGSDGLTGSDTGVPGSGGPAGTAGPVGQFG